MDNLNSKKLAVAVLLIVLTAVLAAFETLTPTVSNVFLGVGMVYLGGQSAVDYKSRS